MRNVTYINAGAGSGKTYRLTEELAGVLQKKKATPGEVILTTFTRKAANDFKARAKAKLYAKGLFEEANQLDAAVIGTIHSVAYSLISKYWYFLGLSPKCQVMPPEEADVYRSESMGEIAAEEQLQSLTELAGHFDQSDTMFWKKDLDQIISYTTNFEIADFADSRQKSIDFYRSFVRAGVVLPEDSEFDAAIEAYDAYNKNTGESAAKTKRTNALEATKRMRNYSKIAALGKFFRLVDGNDTAVAAKQDPGIKPVYEQLENLWRHEDVCKLVEKYITTLFDMAAEWQKTYADFKKSRSLLDYNDLEKYLLQLLNDPTASNQISSKFKYLFVDEFQDCSPMQINIFRKLHETVEHSYWVGDMKQSIYGFRGADPKLVQQVIDEVKASKADGCNMDNLPYSWRSVPAIVGFCNDVFTQAFQGFIKEPVALIPTQPADDKINPLVIFEHRLRNNKNRTTKETRSIEIAAYIAKLIDEGALASEIAVLARTKTELDELPKELKKRSIEVSRSSGLLTDSPAAKLACAVLRLASDSYDSLAKAEIAYLTHNDYDTTRIIRDTLDKVDSETGYPSHDFLDRDIPLLKKISTLRYDIKTQGLAEFVQSALTELDMYEEAKKCAPEQEVEQALNTLIATAHTYQDLSRNLGKLATVYGFIDYLDRAQTKLPGYDKGVCLTTMHDSKGLEWRYVILLSMQTNPAKDSDLIKKNYFGVHFRRDAQQPDSSGLGKVYIQLAPYIYGNNTNPPKSIIGSVKDRTDWNQIRRDYLNEEARVLYVAMTRPTHQLVLTKDIKDPYQWMVDIDVDADKHIGEHSFKLEGVDVANNDGDGNADGANENFVNFTFVRSGRQSAFEPRDIQPSGIPGSNSCQVKAHNFGQRIKLNPLPESIGMDHVGHCVHHIFQLCNPDFPSDAKVGRLIDDYGLSSILPDKEQIRQAWQRLVVHVENLHGSVCRHLHERPFHHVSNGQRYTGSIDLTFDTPQGTVLVDFKTCPMGETAVTDPLNKHYVGMYSGQMTCYRNALTQAGHKVCATYVYYPISGLLVELV